MHSEITNKLLAWYQAHQRQWPWRGHPDAYAVWVSEIMAQQTRLDTVLPYYHRWMDRFPTIQSLAAAAQQEVLHMWEGLGYYGRARNLHKAAQMIVHEYNGALPSDLKSLRSLPGIGRYTAGAIASLAFGQDEPVVDGNVKRVFSRLFNLEEAVDSPAGEKKLWEIAAEHLPRGQAADYNQALMDLGAMICLPASPDCENCPLIQSCRANSLGIQAELPRKKPKLAVPHHTVAAAVIWQGQKVLLAQRPSNGLLGGMWEFPGGKQEDGEDLETALKREIQEELGVRIQVEQKLGIYKHAYTHFRVTLHAFSCKIESGKPHALEASALCWAQLDELAGYPMGKLDREISRELLSRRESQS